MSTELTFKFNMGDIVQDKITKFKGTITGMYHYITGCNHYGLVPMKLNNGKIGEHENIEESRLVLIKSSVKEPAPKRGGPTFDKPDQRINNERNLHG